MNKYFLLMIVGFTAGFAITSITSCKKKYACEAEELAVTISSGILGEVLNCKKPEKLEPYIKKLTTRLDICGNGFMKFESKSEMCKKSVDDIIRIGITALPKEAECDGGFIRDVIAEESVE